MIVMMIFMTQLNLQISSQILLILLAQQILVVELNFLKVVLS